MSGLKIPFGRKKQKEELAPVTEAQAASPKATAPVAGIPSRPAAPPPSPTPAASPVPVAAATLTKPPEPAAESASNNAMSDVFAHQADERDQFHKTIAKELEAISVQSLLLESRDVARSMHRMGRRRK